MADVCMKLYELRGLSIPEMKLNEQTKHCSAKCVCFFVLRFYGPVNPMGPCRAQSDYLTTRLLGRLIPLSG